MVQIGCTEAFMSSDQTVIARYRLNDAEDIWLEATLRHNAGDVLFHVTGP